MLNTVKIPQEQGESKVSRDEWLELLAQAGRELDPGVVKAKQEALKRLDPAKATNAALARELEVTRAAVTMAFKGRSQALLRRISDRLDAIAVELLNHQKKNGKAKSK